jgi:PAS domain S-box-containing protein
MATKPTFEELERRIEELEKEASERKRTERALRTAAARAEQEKHKLEAIIASIRDGVCIVSTEFKVLYENKICQDYFGEHAGEYCYMAYHNRDKVCKGCPVAACFKDGKVHTMERTLRTEKGTLYIEHTASPLCDSTGKIIASIEIVRDISKPKRAEEALRKREAELEAKSHDLREVDTALRVLSKQRQKDKKELEEKILSNVKQLVSPHLEKLKKSRLDAYQTTALSILESSLNDIVSPFAYMLSSKYLGFTPTQIQVASLVREGKTTKEIAELLNSSDRTVECHRQNIRMKIGIKNKKANLRSFLLSM